MLTHKQVWAAIDALAARYDMSASGLARAAGLDPTTFNRSKRVALNGKQRWPSTESISKILAATGANIEDFTALVVGSEPHGEIRYIPLIGLAQAGWDENDSESKELLKSALLDYEKVYQRQKPTFAKLWSHNRGELLFGLASGWSILGEHQKARAYLKLIVAEVKETDYEAEAKKWLNKKPGVIQHDCRGCHSLNGS